MELFDVLTRRKMVRSFSPDPVPVDVLDRIVAGALRSPSAGNSGGWSLIVLVGPGETSRFWSATTTPRWRATSRRWSGLSAAPVVVVVVTSPDRYVQRYAEPDKGGDLGNSPDMWPVPMWFVDAGMAVLALLEGAVDQGLGACFLGNFRGESDLISALGIPDDHRFVGAVLLGSVAGEDPASSSASRPRRTWDNAVHRNGWDGGRDL